LAFLFGQAPGIRICIYVPYQKKISLKIDKNFMGGNETREIQENIMTAD